MQYFTQKYSASGVSAFFCQLFVITELFFFVIRIAHTTCFCYRVSLSITILDLRMFHSQFNFSTYVSCSMTLLCFPFSFNISYHTYTNSSPILKKINSSADEISCINIIIYFMQFNCSVFNVFITLFSIRIH